MNSGVREEQGNAASPQMKHSSCERIFSEKVSKRFAYCECLEYQKNSQFYHQ
jgi:hypothetical protein